MVFKSKYSKYTSTGTETLYAGALILEKTAGNLGIYQISHAEGRYTPTLNYEYTYTDHLGNTRLMYNVQNGIATTTQTNSYDPWGLELKGSSFSNTPLEENKFKYNGKETQTETAWMDYGARMYDSQIGRWHAVDPMADHPNQVGISPYAFSNNNPVNLIDPDGRLPIPLLPMLIGAAVAGTVDYGFQVAGNYVSGKSGMDAWTNVDGKSIAISAAAGFATMGLSSVGGRAAQAAITTTIDAAESVGKQMNTGKGVTLTQTASDVVSNKIGGTLLSKLNVGIDTKSLERTADRTARVSAGDVTSTGRASAARTAGIKLNTANAYNQTVSGVAGNTTQKVSDASRVDMKTSPIYKDLGVAPSDATRTYKPLKYR